MFIHVQTIWQRGPSYSFIVSPRERSRGAAQERHEHRLTVDSWQFLCISKPRPASNSLSIIISVPKADSGYLEIWVRRFSLPVKSLAVRLWENSPPDASPVVGPRPTLPLWGTNFRNPPSSEEEGLVLTYVVVANKIAVIFVIQDKFIINVNFFSL